MTTPEPCVLGPHTPPENLEEVFPPVADMPNMAKALSASYYLCGACVERHRKLVAPHVLPVQQVLMLGLIWSAIQIHNLGHLPGDTGAAVMRAMLPGHHDVFSKPTLQVLKAIRVDQVEGPAGHPAATYDPDQIAGLLEALSTDERALVWHDSLMFATSVLWGDTAHAAKH